MKYLMIIPLAIALTGCSVYSNYKRPAMEYEAAEVRVGTTEADGSTGAAAPSASGAQAEGSDTLAALATMPWRELFRDPCLQQWIEAGLKSNTDLRIAQLRTEEAAATLTASKLAFLPSASLSADGSVARKSASRFTVGPSASWELDIFGKQRNLKKGAEAAFYASEAYRQAVQTSLVATIAESYYTLLMLDGQLAISERTLKTWDENIRVMQALKKAGRTNEAGVLQAQANRMRVENNVLSLRDQIRAQENAVRSLLLNPLFDLTRGTLTEQEFPEALSGGIPLQMLSNRPDVREAEYDLQKAFYDVNVARSAFYPSLTLSGNLGWSTTSGSGVSSPSSFIASALGSLTAPLFSRGKLRADLKTAKAEYEIASLNFQQKLLDAGLEVNDALSAWQTARDRLVIDRQQIQTLQDAVRTSELLMRNTSTTYLEVLTAQQHLLEAELTAASDRYAVLSSLITLYSSLATPTD